MFKSNPEISVAGPPSQFGETQIWMNKDRVWGPGDPVNNYFTPYNPDFLPAGRIQDAPEYLTPEVKWTTPSAPPPEQLVLFKDVLLIRDAIRWHVPSNPPWAIQTVNSPFPRCVYTNVHWLSNTVGTTDDINPPSGSLGDIRWFLYYGDATGLQTASFDALIDQTSLVGPRYTNGDSVGTDSNPSDIDTNAIQQVGWCLYMIKRKLTQDTLSEPTQAINDIILPIIGFTIPLITQDPPIVVEHHVYGAWQLVPPTIPPAPLLQQPQYSILDLTVSTEWQIFHNALGWPPHSLTLSPFLA